MPTTVKLPMIGKIPTTYVYAGGAAVVGIVTFAWITRRRDEETALAEVDPTSDSVAYDAFGNPIEGTGGASDYVPPTTTNPGGSYDSTGGITTNSAWTQAATEYLISIGYNAVAVSSALGKFLARQPLNTVEVDTVRAALAAQGEPPTGGPWVITPEGPSGASVAVGNVTNLRRVSATSTSVTVAWNEASGATSYRYTRNPPGASRTVSGTTWTSSGLTPSTSYVVTVQGRNNAGNLGPATSISVATAPATTSGTPPSGGTRIGAPRTVGAAADTPGRIGVIWSAVPGATAYRLRREGSGPGVTSGWVNVGNTNHTVLTARFSRPTQVRIRVQALGPGGKFGGNKLSNSVTVKP